MDLPFGFDQLFQGERLCSGWFVFVPRGPGDRPMPASGAVQLPLLQHMRVSRRVKRQLKPFVVDLNFLRPVAAGMIDHIKLQTGRRVSELERAWALERERTRPSREVRRMDQPSARKSRQC